MFSDSSQSSIFDSGSGQSGTARICSAFHGDSVSTGSVPSFASSQGFYNLALVMGRKKNT